MTRGPTVCLGSYTTLITITAIVLSSLYYYTEGTSNDRTRIQIHQNVIQDDASSEDTDHQEPGQRINWIGFGIMTISIGIAILYKSKTWYQKRKQSEADAKQREYEEMEETIRLMVHILMQEKKTTRKHGEPEETKYDEPEETKYDEPILATYERWDALTDRMNDMGLLTTC